MNNEQPVRVGNWLITMLIMCIPLVNFIMLFVWAFGGDVETSKANWAKASLLWMLIGLFIGMLFFHDAGRRPARPRRPGRLTPKPRP